MGHTRFRRIMRLAGNLAGKKVLDVGCASGYLGTELKKHGAYVVGSDVSAAAAEVAKQKLDEIYRIEPGEILPADAKTKEFDIIILGEVLEHVFDPAQMLMGAKRFLKSDGFFIITTPNFLTWTNRARFVFGKFAYQDQGMFDFGHIRWFTYPYLIKVLNESGLKMVQEEHIIFPGKLTGLLKHWPGLFAWQFILKARKS